MTFPRLFRAALAAALVIGAQLAVAQPSAGYPNRPIKAVVPYAPGGMTDVSSRAIMERLGHELGQPVVVENKAGAASTLASNWMASQKPDGYTLYAAPVSLVINPILQGAVQYEPRRDFEPISLMLVSPFVLQANPALRVKNMAELLALLRAQPGKYAIGTSGAGSVNHLAAEYFLRSFDLKAQVVHYRGGAPAAQDLMAGTIQLMFSAANEAAPLLQSGRTVGIAVTTARRLPLLPDLPTMAEASGLRDFDAVFWMAVMVPAHTPAPVVARLREAMQKVGADGELRERMDRDEAKWGRLIRELDIREGS